MNQTLLARRSPSAPSRLHRPAHRLILACAFAAGCSGNATSGGGSGGRGSGGNTTSTGGSGSGTGGTPSSGTGGTPSGGTGGTISGGTGGGAAAATGGATSSSGGTAGTSTGGASGSGGAGGTPAAPTFAKRIVAQGLGAPWEITWGPDQRLWITERTAKRVVRMDPQTGNITPAITISEIQQSGTQDGLLGMALHPRLLNGSDYVYVAYTYNGPGGSGVANRRAKIVRLTFDAQAGTLAQPMELLSNLPASTDHNSGRLIIGPDEKLYYTIGDQGANQFEHKCDPVLSQELPTAADVTAQDRSKYPGKILRLNLDGSIPDDNPILGAAGGARSHVYTYGHRNAQGIVFAGAGILYADEQGPKTDDELNRITAGKNYGWPHVAGYQDDKAYVYGNWSASTSPACSTLTFSDYEIPASVPQQKESQWTGTDFTAPLITFFTVESSHNFRDPKCSANEFICWPTIAPSSLDFYPADPNGVPGWSHSLLLTSLKKGSVYRVQLSNDLLSVQGQAEQLFATTNRYRDIAINPNHRIFYVVTDNQGQAAGPGGGPTGTLENSGAVLEFSLSAAP